MRSESPIREHALRLTAPGAPQDKHRGSRAPGVVHRMGEDGPHSQTSPCLPKPRSDQHPFTAWAPCPWTPRCPPHPEATARVGGSPAGGGDTLLPHTGLRGQRAPTRFLLGGLGPSSPSVPPIPAPTPSQGAWPAACTGISHTAPSSTQQTAEKRSQDKRGERAQGGQVPCLQGAGSAPGQRQRKKGLPPSATGAWPFPFPAFPAADPGSARAATLSKQGEEASCSPSPRPGRLASPHSPPPSLRPSGGGPARAPGLPALPPLIPSPPQGVS